MNTTEQVYGYIQRHLEAIQNPVIFEFGICDGHHTKMLLSFCKSAPCYFGFEPDPRNVERVKASGIDRRINFYSDAIGRVTGRVPFHLSTTEPGGGVGQSSLSEFTPVLTQTWPWLKHMSTIEVKSWRLDDFCREHQIGTIDFLWMDVQGAERLVFEGASVMLPNVKLLWTEYDNGTFYRDSSTLQDILAWFPGWSLLANLGGDVLLKNSAQLP